MIVTVPKNNEVGGKRGKTLSLRKRTEKLFSFLAVLAVALNFLVPVTHGLISNGEAGEYLEICTNQGIKIVKIDLATEKNESVDEGMDGSCMACPDCPLCPVGKTTSSSRPNQISSEFLFASAIRESFMRPALAGNIDPPWCRPALRAPPMA